jgi:uncharacterized protein YecT (DUF1311 family)
MVDEKRAPADLEDVDARLKEASDALIAEMEQLIRRAKILQMEHKAIIEERRKNKKLGKR